MVSFSKVVVDAAKSSRPPAVAVPEKPVVGVVPEPNVPATPPLGGTLRHKGWRATKVDLPALPVKQDAAIIAPAEIEIE